MIVYGDAGRVVTLRDLLISISGSCPESGPVPGALDLARDYLIGCGIIEQAVADTLWDTGQQILDANLLPLVQDLTDTAADSFLCWWLGTAAECAERGALNGSAFASFLNAGGPKIDAHLIVKAPEGFAFYTLYPEQYALAASQWIRSDSPDGPIVVVGVRSIGTTLSAVVAAALRRHGRRTMRMTVRPCGPPFERTARIAPESVAGAAWALVADEGPGLSGSSMAAVAEALARAGMDPNRIIFLPAHDELPGPHAPDESKRWWTAVRRFTVPREAVRWGGQSFTEILAHRSAEMLSCDAAEIRMDDLGGGLWRRHVNHSSANEIAAAISFERSKYLCSAHGGAILWKYAALATERQRERLDRVAALGWTPAIVDCCLGFVARQWIDGTLHVKEDVDDVLLRQIGRYIAEAAGPTIGQSESENAVTRLRDMVHWNVFEAFDEPTAGRADEIMSRLIPEDRPAYGDGRMAPYEWIRTPDGRLFKTDSEGHDSDHTAVGTQSIEWDAAGAAIEWDLDNRQITVLLEGAGFTLQPGYLLAYAAFRMGLMKQCADTTAPDSGDRYLLETAYMRYRRHVGRLLSRTL